MEQFKQQLSSVRDKIDEKTVKIVQGIKLRKGLPQNFAAFNATNGNTPSVFQAQWTHLNTNLPDKLSDSVGLTQIIDLNRTIISEVSAEIDDPKQLERTARIDAENVRQIYERVSFGPLIAESKWNSNSTGLICAGTSEMTKILRDPTREAEVIERATSFALEHDLDPQFIARLFRKIMDITFATELDYIAARQKMVLGRGEGQWMESNEGAKNNDDPTTSGAGWGSYKTKLPNHRPGWQ